MAIHIYHAAELFFYLPYFLLKLLSKEFWVWYKVIYPKGLDECRLFSRAATIILFENIFFRLAIPSTFIFLSPFCGDHNQSCCVNLSAQVAIMFRAKVDFYFWIFLTQRTDVLIYLSYGRFPDQNEKNIKWGEILNGW